MQVFQRHFSPVIPAQAGIHADHESRASNLFRSRAKLAVARAVVGSGSTCSLLAWIPAFAGMTGEKRRDARRSGRIRRFGGAATLLAPLALAGCASTSPAFDARFGDSVRIIQAQQTLDAAAPARNADRGVRSDGRSAAEATGRYVDSFKAPVPPAAPSITLNAGSTSTGR
jgi:hypothetical protein